MEENIRARRTKQVRRIAYWDTSRRDTISESKTYCKSKKIIPKPEYYFPYGLARIVCLEVEIEKKGNESSYFSLSFSYLVRDASTVTVAHVVDRFTVNQVLTTVVID